LDILGKTYPFVLLRLALYALILAASLLWWLLVFQTFRFWPLPGPPWLAWLFGGIAFASVIKLLRSYLLYLLKAAHIAAITQLVLGIDLPAGIEQLRYAKDVVIQRFGQISLLFLIDRLVNAVLRTFNRSIFSMFSFVPGLRTLRRFAQRVLDYSAGYVDEAILSYSIIHPEMNPWKSARDGLILYVQSWKAILGGGFVLALISYLLVAVVAAPGFLIAYGLPQPMREVVMGISLAVALFVKFALMDPFALTSVIVNYHNAIAGQTVNEAWEKRLEDVSDKYREIKERALSWGPPPSPVPGPIRIS
jgi:hypothetical protein